MYQNKYLKYKNKYLSLKNLLKIQYGGETPIINDIDRINLFKESEIEIEMHLNPIYGAFFCYSGYIPNLLYLYKNNLKVSKDHQSATSLINKVCTILPSGIKPTNEIYENIKPIDFGRYIALKYLFKKFINFISIKTFNNEIIFNIVKDNTQIKLTKIGDSDKDKIKGNIKKT